MRIVRGMLRWAPWSGRSPSGSVGALALLLALTGCGSGGADGFTAGAGTLVVSSVAPATLSGVGGTAFTLHGSNFATVAGTTARVLLRTTDGSTPFGGSSTVEVQGSVTGPTTISATAPGVAICGASAIAVTVEVILESGLSSGPVALGLTIVGPDVAAVAPPTQACYAPGPFTLTGGTNLPPVGTPLLVRFSGGPALSWAAGTANQVDVPATVATATTITGAAPPNLSTADFTANVQARFTDGSCSSVRTVGYLAPRVSGIAPVSVPATLPTAFTLTGGANLPPVGTALLVRFSGGPALSWAGGTANQVDVPATVATATTIAGTTPTNVSTTAFAASVRPIFVGGPGLDVLPLGYDPPPVITDVQALRAEVVNGGRTFLSRCPAPLRVLGSNFSGLGTLVVHTQAGGPGAPVGPGALGGTVVVTATQIDGLSPADATVVADTQIAVTFTNPDGQSATFTNANLVLRTAGRYANANATAGYAGLNVEMEMAVNPTDARRAAGLTHTRLATGAVTVYRTTDAGVTWTTTDIDTTVDGLSAGDRIDPRAAYDRFGNLYIAYFTRTPRNLMVLQSFDDGATFPSQQLVTPPSASIDKEFLVIGPDGANPAQDAIYVGWDDFPGNFVAGATCTGAGAPMSAFSAPVPFSDAPGVRISQFSNACVGPDGALHVVWQDLFADGGSGPVDVMYDVDPDGLFGPGTFGLDTLIATTNVGAFESVPAQAIRTIYCNAEVAVPHAGPLAGRAIVVYADDGVAGGDDHDIYAVFADPPLPGVFSAPVRINDDLGITTQWHPSVRADPVTGALVCAWHDCRDDAVNNRSHGIWASMSLDGGVTWLANLRCSDAQSDPADLTEPFGNEYLDYLGLAIYDGCCYVSWGDNSNSTGDNADALGETDAYVTLFQLR